MRRKGEIVFGLIAIVAGVGLIAAVIAGVDVPSTVLFVVPLVVIGWAIYHWIVVRPAPYGVRPPHTSDEHEEIT